MSSSEELQPGGPGAEIGKYLVVASKSLEIDPVTGDNFIYCKVTNTYIKEAKSAELRYIEFKSDPQFYKQDDLKNIEEMNKSKVIEHDIHIAWKTLNPSGGEMI